MPESFGMSDDEHAPSCAERCRRKRGIAPGLVARARVHRGDDGHSA